MATQSGVKVVVTIEGKSINASSSPNPATASLGDTLSASLAQGTSAGQVDKVYHKALTLSTSATNLDLDSGSNVKDPASQADQDFAKLHWIIVENTDGTDNVLLGGNAAEVPYLGAVNDKVVIGPGKFAVIPCGGTDGAAVTASTGDIVSLAASANTPVANVWLIGR